MRRNPDLSMDFVHRDPEFGQLLRAVGAARSCAPSLVEKDYWVVHALWGMQAAGWGLWFKGGTSLSKGFGLIERFSEDLDLKVEGPPPTRLPAKHNWRSTGAKAVEERRSHFGKLAEDLKIPDLEIGLDSALSDEHYRNAVFQAQYDRSTDSMLPRGMEASVRLEIGNARVLPAMDRPIRSWVHEFLDERDQLGDFLDNRVAGVCCVSPVITLLEKCEAMQRGYGNPARDASRYVRHYEDAGRIIQALEGGAAWAEDAGPLYREMRERRELRQDLEPGHDAFRLQQTERARELEQAWRAIEPMHWGERVPLRECGARIRRWLLSAL